jgi:hypothetical protein
MEIFTIIHGIATTIAVILLINEKYSRKNEKERHLHTLDLWKDELVNAIGDIRGIASQMKVKCTSCEFVDGIKAKTSDLENIEYVMQLFTAEEAVAFMKCLGYFADKRVFVEKYKGVLKILAIGIQKNKGDSWDEVRYLFTKILA